MRGRVAEDHQFRWHLQERLAALPVNESLFVPHDLLADAYPPRGDGWTALALALSGGMPEPRQATSERVREEAERHGCEVWIDFYGDARFTKRSDRCPACFGGGQMREAAVLSLDEYLASTEIRPDATAFAVVPCSTCGGTGRVAATGNPDARVGDYRDVEGWLATQQLKRAQARQSGENHDDE